MIWQRVAGVIAGSALCLSGCANVPRSSEVHAGAVVNAGESSQFIRVIAAPPSRGASPQQIVRGFLEANASHEDSWAIARRYLTADAAQGWQPGTATAVYDSARLRVTRSGNHVRVRVPVIATLTTDGSLRTLPEARIRQLDFEMVRVAGQPAGDGTSGREWRITDPEPGILISLSDLRRGYRTHQAYFIANSTGQLVPDGRLLPVVGPGLATSLAELVLRGPGKWLSGAVHGGAPEGTSLALGAVPVADGVAIVQLSREALAATPAQRRELAAAMTWTLTQVPGVTSVRLTVESQPYDVPGAPLLMDRSIWQSKLPEAALLGPKGTTEPCLFLSKAGILTRVTQDGRVTAQLRIPRLARASRLAISLDERSVALLLDTGQTIWTGPLALGHTGAPEARRIEAKGATSLSYAPDGSLWFVDSRGIWRAQPGLEPQRVDLPAAVGTISAVKVSSDGARAAIVAGSKVYLAAVVGAASDQPATLGKPRLVSEEITDVRDASWRDSTQLDVLATLAGSGSQIITVSTGDGSVLANGTPAKAESVTAAPRAATVVVTRADRAYRAVGMQWRDAGDAAQAAYPG